MIFAVIALSVLIAYFIIENMFVLHRRYENFGGDVKVMHISDVHNAKKGTDNRKIYLAAKNEKPDLIFITGDFVSRNTTDFKSAEILLNHLCETAPVFIVHGNHEQSLPPEFYDKFRNMVAESNAVMLVNNSQSVTLKNRKFHICGVQQEYSTYKKNNGYKNLDKFSVQDMISAVGENNTENTLLLAHNPLWAEVYSNWGADYAFCGHVHGGAVRIGNLGLLSPERKFFPKYSKGVYKIGDMKLCVSAGIGKIRLFNPPEIVIYMI